MRCDYDDDHCSVGDIYELSTSIMMMMIHHLSILSYPGWPLVLMGKSTAGKPDQRELFGLTFCRFNESSIEQIIENCWA